VAAYPGREPALEDAEAERLIGTLMETVTAARNLRATAGVPARARVRLLLRPLDRAAHDDLELLRDRIQGLARAGAVEIVEALPQGLAAARAVTGPAEIALPLEGLLDLDTERARLGREMDRLGKELAGHQAKLSNEQFVSRAKPEAVEKVRAASRELTDRLDRLKETLAQLES
jgi:valyl-tRNA synthetase